MDNHRLGWTRPVRTGGRLTVLVMKSHTVGRRVPGNCCWERYGQRPVHVHYGDHVHLQEPPVSPLAGGQYAVAQMRFLSQRGYSPCRM